MSSRGAGACEFNMPLGIISNAIPCFLFEHPWDFPQALQRHVRGGSRVMCQDAGMCDLIMAGFVGSNLPTCVSTFLPSRGGSSDRVNDSSFSTTSWIYPPTLTGLSGNPSKVLTMAVKDLVGLFESQAGPPHSTSRVSGSRHNSRPHASQLPPEIPSPNPIRPPARFLRHPLLNIRDHHDDTHLPDVVEGLPSTSDSPSTTRNDNVTTPTTQHDTITTIHDTMQRDVVPPSRAHIVATDEVPIDVSPSYIPSRRVHATLEPRPVRAHEPKSKILPARPNEDEYEMEKLLPNSGFSTGANAPRTPPGTLRSRSPFKLPADSDSASVASTSTIIHEKTLPLGPHTPIPATTIFARDAAPLYIPHLDEYISTIPAPSFPSLPVVSQYSGSGKGKGKEKTTGSGMFPPMDRLAATGKTLDDLEHNSEVAPGWRNRDTIFGILTSAALGLTVCTFMFD